MDLSTNFHLKAFLFMLRDVQHVLKIGKPGAKKIFQKMAGGQRISGLFRRYSV
jgi:hypothetical protein